MTAIDVRLQFRRIAKAIAAQAEVAGGTEHASTTGNIREEITNKFLKPHLPKTVAIKSGVIIDSNGNRSKQQDCILIDKRLPLIDVGSKQHAIIIAESVIATIEIKSFLNSEELFSTLESIAITRSLTRSGEHVYKKGYIETKMPKAMPILTYVFAYDGLGLNTLMGKIAEFAIAKNDGGLTPEAVCILEKGIILRSQSTININIKNRVAKLPRIQPQLTMEELKKDALFAFYRRLIDDIIPLQIIHYDIDPYYAETVLE